MQHDCLKRGRGRFMAEPSIQIELCHCKYSYQLYRLILLPSFWWNKSYWLSKINELIHSRKSMNVLLLILLLNNYIHLKLSALVTESHRFDHIYNTPHVLGDNCIFHHFRGHYVYKLTYKTNLTKATVR